MQVEYIPNKIKFINTALHLIKSGKKVLTITSSMIIFFNITLVN